MTFNHLQDWNNLLQKEAEKKGIIKKYFPKHVPLEEGRESHDSCVRVCLQQMNLKGKLKCSSNKCGGLQHLNLFPPFRLVLSTENESSFQCSELVRISEVFDTTSLDS